MPSRSPKSSSGRWLLLIVLLCLGMAVKAQGDMRFFGTATKDGSPLSGAAVTVLMDGRQIINLTTGKNGKFKFTIDIGHSYRINFSAPGCVDMYMTMDLHTPPEKAWIYPDYVVQIPFFAANDPKVKTELFAQKPFIKVVFDGSQGFYDDPKYRLVEEIFKDPMEEQRKQQEIAKKEAEEKAKREAEEAALKADQERERLASEDAERRRLEEEKHKNSPTAPVITNEEPEPTDPTMETDAILLEKEKQERLSREKQNKNIRAQYENNLLKLVAESERRNNLQKFNRMKDDAQNNSVVEAMRREAERKAQQDFLVGQQKERDRQTLANRQVKEQRIRLLVETSALVERDYRSSTLRPVVSSVPLSYTPSPNVVVTFQDGFFSDVTSTVISWPGGKRTIFRVKEYWWGTRYYYRDEAEIDAKTYDAELYRHKRS
jgi:hypothetical protein